METENHHSVTQHSVPSRELAMGYLAVLTLMDICTLSNLFKFQRILCDRCPCRTCVFHGVGAKKWHAESWDVDQTFSLFCSILQGGYTNLRT